LLKVFWPYRLEHGFDNPPRRGAGNGRSAAKFSTYAYPLLPFSQRQQFQISRKSPGPPRRPKTPSQRPPEPAHDRFSACRVGQSHERTALVLSGVRRRQAWNARRKIQATLCRRRTSTQKQRVRSWTDPRDKPENRHERLGGALRRRSFFGSIGGPGFAGYLEIAWAALNCSSGYA